jgi:REP element-mobilizing transposase RayT
MPAGTPGTDGALPDYFLAIWAIGENIKAQGVGRSDHVCYFLTMARLPRVVVADVAHHVTQRGNARQVIFACDADRVIYLELLRQYSQLNCLSVLGYCLMSNHVHLIAVPQTGDALAQTLKNAHGRYASYWKCTAVIERARVAGAILLLSTGRIPSVGGASLRGVEPGAGGYGCGG